MRDLHSGHNASYSHRQFFQNWQLLLLAGCLCLYTGTALAQPDPAAPAAEPPAQPEEANAEEAPPSRLDYSETLQNYQTEIQRIESEYGVWGNGLSEQLTGLGETYQQRGQHGEAIEIFRRAIHVNRINNGLYNLTQVPIVESLVESLSARGQWEQVHERHQYLYWLYQRSYGSDDPRMLPVIERLGGWYLNDYALNQGYRDPHQLLDAHNAFTDAQDIVRDNYGENDLRMIEPLRGEVMSNWYFATYSASTVSKVERSRQTRDLGGSELDSHEYYRAMSGGPVSSGIYYPDSDLPHSISRHVSASYRGGKKALAEMVDIYTNNPEAPPGALASAKIELADWQLLFHEKRSAASLYREAWQELAGDEATRDQLDDYFSRPVALPVMALVESQPEADNSDTAPEDGSTQAQTDADIFAKPESTEPKPAEQVSYVLVQFDVSRYGEPKKIDVMESYPEDDRSNRSKAVRSLQQTRFRPRLEDGEPVETEGMLHKYLFID